MESPRSKHKCTSTSLPSLVASVAAVMLFVFTGCTELPQNIELNAEQVEMPAPSQDAEQSPPATLNSKSPMDTSLDQIRPEPIATAASTKTRTPVPARAPADPLVIFDSTEPALNQAKDEALRIIAYNLQFTDWEKRNAPPRAHSAGIGYNAPWIRDSYAWGMIPIDVYPPLAPYTSSEIRYWMNLQRPSGQFVSVSLSGYYDETPILISGVVDSYRVTGDRQQLGKFAPALRKAWKWMAAHIDRSGSAFLVRAALGRKPARTLLPPIASDWADQIARDGYAGQLNMLWYHASEDMAVLEAELGNKSEAARYRKFAESIKADINRVLWTTTAPHARNAPPVAAFGHFRSWLPSERDYFEVDTNMLAIVYGVANAEQSESILGFVSRHADYLLGSPSGMPPPAKTVYGDYDPRDYAVIRHLIRDGGYHNGYWIPLGGLAARAYAMRGYRDMALRIIRSTANAFTGDLAKPVGGSGYEWYTAVGEPRGAPAYQWSSRSLLISLWTTYAGIDVGWGSSQARNIRVAPLAGGVTVRIRHLGKLLTFRTHGEGAFQRARIGNSKEVRNPMIPVTLLDNNMTIDVFLGQ